MDVLSASTPSPGSGIHTPPTPRHGYGDSWVPFSPRKSARLSSQRAVNRTPSPNPSARPSYSHQPKSPKTARKSHNNHTMATPVTSPRKKRLPPMESNRRASGSLTADGTIKAAAALGLTSKTDSAAGSTNVSSNAGMLPTPAKTPARKHSEQNEMNIKAIARNLFAPDEELMPTPKKKRAKKYTGISMDSFAAEDVEESIQIFTDSHERIPEVDSSLENPFYGEPSAAVHEPVKRRSKRKTVSVPGGGSQTVDEAMSREDGLVYVFRGKRIFRTFAESEEALKAQSDEQEEDGEGGVEARLRRPLTRSSIKPRLLFPVANLPKKDVTSHEDEEAVTDIEDHVMLKDDAGDVANPETPRDAVDETPETPAAPKFAPASPPITGRTTRSGNKAAEETTPVKAAPGGKRSPFDGWRRVKNGTEAHGQKRAGESLASDAAPKRNRV